MGDKRKTSDSEQTAQGIEVKKSKVEIGNDEGNVCVKESSSTGYARGRCVEESSSTDNAEGRCVEESSSTDNAEGRCVKESSSSDDVELRRNAVPSSKRQRESEATDSDTGEECAKKQKISDAKNCAEVPHQDDGTPDTEPGCSEKMKIIAYDNKLVNIETGECSSKVGESLALEKQSVEEINETVQSTDGNINITSQGVLKISTELPQIPSKSPSKENTENAEESCTESKEPMSKPLDRDNLSPTVSDPVKEPSRRFNESAGASSTKKTLNTPFQPSATAPPSTSDGCASKPASEGCSGQSQASTSSKVATGNVPVSSLRTKRTRMRHVINVIQKLLEFYFSRANICKDSYMKKHMDEDNFIELSLFLNFNKIKSLTNDIRLIRHAANNSKILLLSPDETRVKTTLDISPKPDELDCTIYVDQLSRNHNLEWVWNHFSQFGTVEYVSLPVYKDTKKSRGFAFVEFDVPSSADKALAAFGAGTHDMSDMDHLMSMRPFRVHHHLMDDEEYHHLHHHFDDGGYMMNMEPDSSSQGWEDNDHTLYGLAGEHEGDEGLFPPPHQEHQFEIMIDDDQAALEPGPGLLRGLNDLRTRSPHGMDLSEERGISGLSEDLEGSSLLDESSTIYSADGEEEEEANEGQQVDMVDPQDLHCGGNASEIPTSLPASAQSEPTTALKKKKKKIHRRIRMKEKEKKRLLELKSKPKEVDLVQLVVMSKREWKRLRDNYLSEQKKVLGTCKQIMREEREQQNALRIEFDNVPKVAKQKPVKVIGTIIKITLDKPLVDKQLMVQGIRACSGPDIAFVDAVEGERFIYARFNSPESAMSFLTDSVWKNRSSLLVWDEEDKYWEKIHADWQARVGGPKRRKNKKRGKEKVALRWRKRQEQLERQADLELVPTVMRRQQQHLDPPHSQ